MALKVGELVQYLKVDNKPHKRGLAEARRDSEREGDKAGKGFADAFGKHLRPGLMGIVKLSLGAFGAAMAAGAAQVAAKFVGAFLAKTAAILGPGLAALALLVPAAYGAAALAVGSLKLALSGVGDALKAGMSGDAEKLDEALRGLAPSAQKVVKETVFLRGAFDALKKTVQESFFAPLVGEVQPLAFTYFPMLRDSMRPIAAAFGQAAQTTARWLRSADVVRPMASAFDAMAEAVRNVAAGLPGIVKGLTPLVTVGASFLPGLTAGFDQLTQRFAAWMQQIADSGQLYDFISGGLSGLGDLVQVFSRLSAIVHTVFGAAIDAGLLDALDQLGGLLQTVVREAAPGLQALIQGLLQGLLALAPAAAPIGQALGAIMTALAPLLPVLGNLAAVVLVALASALQLIAAELGPLIALFAQWATQVLPMLLPAMAELLGQALPLATQLFTELATALAPLIPEVLSLANAFLTQLLPVFPQWFAALRSLIPPLTQLVTALVPIMIDVIRMLIPLIPIMIAWLRNAILVFTALVGVAGLVISILARVVSAFRSTAVAVGEFMAKVNQVPGQVRGAFAGAGSWLWDAGRRIIDGLIDGIKSKVPGLTSLLGWVSSKIPSWKGPLDRDRRLLRPTGATIMAGLTTGMRASLPQLRSVLGDVTAAIAAPAAPSTSTPPAQPRQADDVRMLAELRTITDLLSRLNLRVGPEGLALAVRKGEKSLRYT